MESESREASAVASARVATTVAAVMIAQQVAGKATRDALFLSNYEATSLPTVMVVAAGLSLGVVLLVSRMMTRFTPGQVVPYVFAFNAALFAAEWGVGRGEPRLAALMVYLHTAALGAAVVSVFWSVVNERFDPHSAKQVIARVGAGAAAGGVIGGVVAWQAAQYLPLSSMLPILAGANLLCAVGMPPVSRGGETHAASADVSTSGLGVIRGEPYLRQLALLVLLLSLGEAFIDYVMKARAADAYPDAKNLIMFFAIFYTVTGVVGFLIQAGVVKRALQGLGLVGTIAAFPFVIVAGSVLGLLFPRMWSIVALRGGANVAENSFYRTGYELAYTPLPPAEKRSTKTIIDVAVQKVGTALGGGGVLVVLALAGSHADHALLVVPLVLGGLALVVTGFLHRGYVAALARSLREGAVKLDEREVVDLTTRLTLTEASMALDRQTLLREIEALRLVDAGDIGTAAADGSDPLSDQIAILRGHDIDQTITCLQALRPLRPELIGHVIGLLSATERLSREAIGALSEVADRSAGQLVDALLYDKTPLAVRRRLPRVLAACDGQRAVDGLIEALGSESFRVRDRCAAALVRVLERSGGRVSKSDIVALAIKELREAGPLPQSRRAQTLEFVFTLLSLVGDREALQLAFAALRSDDAQLRGTGLEYVENVVPADLYKSLEPYVASPPRARRTKRPDQDIVQELLTSMTGFEPVPRP